MRLVAIILARLVLLASAGSYWLSRPVVSGVDENELIRSLRIATSSQLPFGTPGRTSVGEIG